MIPHHYASLNKILDTLGYKERLQVLEAVGKAVRNIYKTGFSHRNLHGVKFLLRFNGEQPDIKVDGLQRSSFKRITSKRRIRELANLALPYFFHLGLKERLAFLIGYSGGLKEARAFLQHEGKRLERFILKRSSVVVDRKVRQSCKVNKYFDKLILQSGRYKGVYLRKNRDLIPASFLSLPLDFMYRKEVGVLKDFHAVRVIRYQDICVKHYMRRGPKNLLKRWLGLSKGKKSFQWALALVYRFIATPEPICYLEGWGGDSFYLSRFVDSTRNLADYLRGVSQEKQKECLKRLSLFLNGMFYRGVYHLDLKGTNVLVGNVGPTFRFYLTDTDAMAISWKGIYRPLYKSLLRITRTLVPYFSREDLVAFAAGCLYNSPVTMRPQDVVDQAFKIETMKQS